MANRNYKGNNGRMTINSAKNARSSAKKAAYETAYRLEMSKSSNYRNSALWVRL